MRIVISSFVFCLSFLYCVQIHTGINRDELRKSEMREYVTKATIQSLEELVKSKETKERDRNYVIASLLERLIVRLPADLDVTVKVITMNVQKGLLDVEVTGEYKNNKGEMDKVIVRRTAIMVME